MTEKNLSIPSTAPATLTGHQLLLCQSLVVTPELHFSKLPQNLLGSVPWLVPTSLGLSRFEDSHGYAGVTQCRDSRSDISCQGCSPSSLEDTVFCPAALERDMCQAGFSGRGMGVFIQGPLSFPCLWNWCISELVS